MKRSNDSHSSGKIVSIQLDIDETLIIDKSAILSQNKVFSLQEFMNLFRKQITREVIQTFQKELNEEINQRTSVICEMIPDDVWKRVFQLCAYGKDISKVFQLKQVCKRWESTFPSAVEEATIQKAISLNRIISLKSLRSLVIETNVEITKGIFTNLFLNLNCLSFDATIRVTSQVSPKMLSQMTNLTSLSLYDGLDDDAELFINNKNLPSLVNLEYLCLGFVDCNPLNSLKKLTRLKELDISRVEYSFEEIESKFGPNLNIIEDLKSLKVITVDLPQHTSDFFKVNALQKRHPHVRFRWYMAESDGFYEGSFSDDNLLSGKGKIVFRHGRGQFEGEFKNDKKEGRGTFYYFKNHCRYEGDWKDDIKEGMGTYFSPDGRYEGEFKNDAMEGKGTFIWRASGDRYQGEYKNNKIEGKGVRYWSNGDRFQGEWKNDESVFGIMHYSNGNSFAGDYKSKLKSREGQGAMFYSNGNKYEGCFENDKRVGKGIFHYSNGEKVEGDESKFTLNVENGTIELLL